MNHAEGAPVVAVSSQTKLPGEDLPPEGEPAGTDGCRLFITTDPGHRAAMHLI